MTRVTLVGPHTEAKLLGSLETLIETTQDFTDSAYTSHEHRERILMLYEKLRHELAVLLRIGVNLVCCVYPQIGNNPGLHGLRLHQSRASRANTNALREAATRVSRLTSHRRKPGMLCLPSNQCCIHANCNMLYIYIYMLYIYIICYVIC